MEQVHALEVHILIGCSDARDMGQIHIDALKNVREKFLSDGIQVEYYAIRTPGSFVTQDVIMDIRNIVSETQRMVTTNTIPVSYFIHVQTHGSLTPNSVEGLCCHTHQIYITQDSPMNCGMLKAWDVSMKLERLLMTEQPEFVLHNQRLKIQSEKDIRTLLREKYAHDGYLSGDWIRSIEDLRTHPRKERAHLQHVIEHDHYLQGLDIHITANLNDYTGHRIIRVDGGDPPSPFWEEVLEYVQQNARSMLYMIEQSEKQEPMAGLFAMSNARHSPRQAAADYYLKRYTKKEIHPEYRPNTIFALKGGAFDMPLTPFGPYIVAGFYFSVFFLKLRDHLVMGYTEQQTQRMLLKIQNDPIINFIVQREKINLIPINTEDLV